MELNKSSESLNSLDSPLETPKIKPESPLSKRVDEKIDDVEDILEEEVFEENNHLEVDNLLKRRLSMKEIQDCDTKHKLKDYINEKKRKIDQSRRILELKYEKYKKCNDFWNIGTIVLSSLLTFTESSKLIFIDDESPILIKNIFDLTPIFFGTVITCSASVIKFKKYQEKMEILNITIDKCINMIAKLKNKREEIKLLSDCGEEFHKIKTDYVNNICKEFSDVYQETERYITNQDYDVYLRIINNSDYNKHIIENDKQTFYKKYSHELDIEKIILNLDIKKEKCCI